MYPRINIIGAEGCLEEWTVVIYIFDSNIRPSLQEQLDDRIATVHIAAQWGYKLLE